jgi:hypothetical protein
LLGVRPWDTEEDRKNAEEELEEAEEKEKAKQDLVLKNAEENKTELVAEEENTIV